MIEEHLNLNKKGGSTAVGKYVPRDATNFRKFMIDQYQSKDREDPFTHFYLKEARNKEMIKNWIEEEK